MPSIVVITFSCNYTLVSSHEDEGGGERRTLTSASLTPPHTNTTKMAFAGKWETESQEGYDAFCKLLGIPDDVITKGRDYKMVTEITQDGNTFSWTQLYPANAKVTNTFSVDKEADMETIGGKKFKATVHMDGGKLSVNFPNYHHTSEIVGGKLIELSMHPSVHPSREADSSCPVAQDRASLRGTVASFVPPLCLAFPRPALVP
ncbi:hypothetical protein F7725_011725 [Dissostichus mawsoni]|uniref:Uncharacterized protein n=1 Tax=Dissostichus mawsoni TaxID=36200 RepID=A0A7J5Z9N1_DISMA|nr:hypothetical protein F7725_011725 [Dissostichus mawsoni]